LIEDVLFDMPSSRPEKKWKAGFLFGKPVGKPDKINNDIRGELCIQQASHQETWYLKKFKNFVHCTQNNLLFKKHTSGDERQEEKKETETSHKRDMDPVKLWARAILIPRGRHLDTL
jgi:hypothetical protein